MRALLVACLVTAAVAADADTARADRLLCARGALHRGPAVDLDVKSADIQDVFRLLSDVGRVNIVVADDVRGHVTLRLARVAWQQVACTIAAVHGLEITVRDNILLVRRRQAR
ncbi:MAG: hypothetical protein H0T89_37155 [Deltaproteobacteria bacterium]|nr:hypothetical protein [Deltaproteobacteria bacterium]MDQ3295700.1 hypothetical protein [Myxococcota bacterium]